MRPAGQMKAGFYPTPERVTDLIASYIQRPAAAVRAIDPCAGDGKALGDLTDLLRPVRKSNSTPSENPTIETFGIELDEHRATVARRTLNRVITGDFFTSRTSPRAYSLLHLNPPYDYSLDDERRLEHKFLKESKDLLTVGGLLILIIPQTRLISLSARHLASYYEDIQVLRFPDPEYQVYKQIVIFATRKADHIPNDRLQAELEKVQTAFQQNQLNPLNDEISTIPELTPQATPYYSLPAVPVLPNFYFQGHEIDPDEAAERIQIAGLWNDSTKLAEIFAPKQPQAIRPLMPLKKGHLALLIASGFINNQVLDDGKLRLIIKGRSFKTAHTETREVPSDDQDKEETEVIEKETFTTTINAFNLHTGEFLAIK